MCEQGPLPPWYRTYQRATWNDARLIPQSQVMAPTHTPRGVRPLRGKRAYGRHRLM